MRINIYMVIKNKFIEYKKNTRKTGFSIVEVVVATSIIAVAIISLFSLLGPAIRNSAKSNNMLIASMLAQEGIELVMNIRDNNWVQDGSDRDDNPNWDTGIKGVLPIESQVGIIDYNDSLIAYAGGSLGLGSISSVDDVFCHPSDPARLYLDNDFYTYTITANRTLFRRVIFVENQDIGGGKHRLKVSSYVRWGVCNDSSNEVKLTNYLYDWMP